ncbi:MAG: 50S ribosomal protein L11 methyltransferase [Longimicrobiaceae bacterium]
MAEKIPTLHGRPTHDAPRWLLLSVQRPAPGEEILLIEALRRLGAHAVEREGERYLALLPPPRALDALLREAEAVIRASTSLRDPWLSWRWRSHEEWAEEWSHGLDPRRIGNHFVVTPRGREPQLREGDRVIRLVPGLGFGTAEHATTRSCLRLLERYLSAGDQVADVGSGSGILAIAAVLLGARRVLALELDPHACAAARENVAENGVQERVEIREVEVRPETLRGEGPFSGIVANLHAGILLPLLPALARALAPRGWMIVSGILPVEKRGVLRAAREAGLHLEAEEVEEGWWTGCFRHLWTSAFGPGQ